MKNLLYSLTMMVAIFALSLSTASCEDDGYDGKNWPAGMEFTANGSGNVEHWVLRFVSGSKLTVVGYDSNDREISSPRYTGVYNIADGRIYIAWVGYSGNSYWNYHISESYQEQWPYYDPSLVISAPYGSGALGGLTFYPGNFLKDPNRGR